MPRLPVPIYGRGMGTENTSANQHHKPHDHEEGNRGEEKNHAFPVHLMKRLLREVDRVEMIA